MKHGRGIKGLDDKSRGMQILNGPCVFFIFNVFRTRRFFSFDDKNFFFPNGRNPHHNAVENVFVSAG
jgi:hypothetical protein